MVWYACGSNGHGVLGVGDLEDRAQLTPVNAPFLLSDSELRCGGCHSAVIDADGRVYTWGSNSHGQLGYDSKAEVQLEPKLLGSFDDVCCGWQHTLLRRGTRLFACGRAVDGQLGRGSDKDLHLREVPFDEAVAGMAACWRQSLVWTAEGRLFGSGHSRKGNLGFTGKTDVFVEIPLPEGRAEKAAAGMHFCAVVLSTGRMLVLGQFLRTGLLDVETLHKAAVDFDLDGDRSSDDENDDTDEERIIDVQCGWQHLAVLTNKHNAFVLGKNNHGQAVVSDGIARVGNVAAIACGTQHTLLLTRTGQVHGCGWNEHGNLCSDDAVVTGGFVRLSIPGAQVAHRILGAGAATFVDFAVVPSATAASPHF
ncbi:MAG: hypothetical protein MHM6MM_004452 [Cercozoa sp. M6MM]